MISLANEKDDILTGTQITEFERKDRMCTKVIDGTTLRICFPKASNTDPFTQNKVKTAVSLNPENSVTTTKLKDRAEDIAIQG